MIESIGLFVDKQCLNIVDAFFIILSAGFALQSTSGSKAKEDLAAAMGAIQVVLSSFLFVVI